MTRGIIGLWATLLFALPVGVAAELQFNVTTIDGVEAIGNLTLWNSAGLTMTVQGQTVEIAADRLLAVRPQSSQISSGTASSETVSPESITARLQLLDGSVLPLTDFTVAARQAAVVTPLAEQPLTISTDEIRLLQFAPFEERVVQLWNELAEKKLEGDVLIVHKKKRTTVDYLTGLLGDVTPEQVTFHFEGDEIPVNRTKVAALAYFHAREPKYPVARGWLKTRAGAQIPIASLALEGENLQVTSVGGLKLRLPVESLREVDYSRGNVTYLSDLQPLRQEWTPRIELPKSAKLIGGYGMPRRDQSFSGSTLTLRWPEISAKSSRTSSSKSTIKMYPKGLALRSRTVLQYRLPPEMKRFVAIAGIDPATADQGNVQLKISTGDQVLWQGEIEGTAPPVEIQVELNGARKLSLLVDYGSNLDFGDRLHLVEARVTK